MKNIILFIFLLFPLYSLFAQAQAQRGTLVQKNWLIVQNTYSDYRKVHLVLNGKIASNDVILNPMPGPWSLRNITNPTGHYMAIHHTGKMTARSLSKTAKNGIVFIFDEECCMNAMHDIYSKIMLEYGTGRVLDILLDPNSPLGEFRIEVREWQDIVNAKLSLENKMIIKEYSSWLSNRTLSESQKECIKSAIILIEVANTCNLPKYGEDIRFSINKMLVKETSTKGFGSIMSTISLNSISLDLSPTLFLYNFRNAWGYDYKSTSVRQYPYGTIRVNKHFRTQNDALRNYMSKIYISAAISKSSLMYAGDSVQGQFLAKDHAINFYNFDVIGGLLMSTSKFFSCYGGIGIRSNWYNYYTIDPSNPEIKASKLNKTPFYSKTAPLLEIGAILGTGKYVSLTSSFSLALIRTTMLKDYSQLSIGLRIHLIPHKVLMYN